MNLRALRTKKRRQNILLPSNLGKRAFVSTISLVPNATFQDIEENFLQSASQSNSTTLLPHFAPSFFVISDAAQMSYRKMHKNIKVDFSGRTFRIKSIKFRIVKVGV